MSDSSEEIRLVVPGEGGGKRLDQFLPGFLEGENIGISRSRIQKLIKEGSILLNGQRAKPRTEVTAGDEVLLRIPEEKEAELGPEEMELSVLFEDEHIIVVDKAPGLVVHPGVGNQSGTLVNGLLHHCRDILSREADEGRPGIVHRLDKETSGCLVAAKSDLAYRSLVAQFSGRQTGKRYVAVVSGVPRDFSGRIENRIGRHPVHRQKMSVLPAPGGKEAISDFEVLRQDSNGDWSWVEFRIHTGRTHQIRVHCRECLNCAILGDSIYAQPSRQKTRVERLMLHARFLMLDHPGSGERMEFEAPLPPEFEPFSPVGE